MTFKFASSAVAAVALLGSLGLAGAALGADYTLRIQTHYAPESLSGQALRAVRRGRPDQSGGRIAIEDFMSSSVVKSVETFDAASTGILDGDMTGAAYQTGKDPAFQFVGDIMGGYDSPGSSTPGSNEGGGARDRRRALHQFNMQLVGLVDLRPGERSPRPSRWPAPEDLKDWKFRSPPGIETEIFARARLEPGGDGLHRGVHRARDRHHRRRGHVRR